MNNLLVMSMVVAALVSFSNGQLKVGDAANSDPTCVEMFGAPICTDEYSPICAILNDTYINGSNTCEFCSKYGNTSAIILQIGTTSDGNFTCAPLRIGGKPADDPQCANIYRDVSLCSKELFPICARLENGAIIEGGNKCLFCSLYGREDATIKTLGRICNVEDYKRI